MPRDALTAGEAFPDLTAPSVSGDELVLPDEAAGSWAAVLFYRGHF